MGASLLVPFAAALLAAAPAPQLTQTQVVPVPGAPYYWPWEYSGLPVSTGGSWTIQAADVTGDGRLDLFAGTSNEPDALYVGQPGGGFDRSAAPAPWDASGGSFDSLFVDVDLDGLEDLVVARGPHFGKPGRDYLLLARGDGSFVDRGDLLPEHPAEKPLGPFLVETLNVDAHNFSMGVAAGDLNEDGLVDLVFANGGMGYLNQVKLLSPLEAWLGQDFFFQTDWVDQGLRNDLYLGTPAPAGEVLGPFANASAATFTGPGDLSTDVVMGDFDGDGRNDLFVANFHDFTALGPASNYLSKLYLGVPASPGVLAWEPAKFPPELRPSTSAAAGDVDLDGDLDLFVTHESRAVLDVFERSRLYANSGAGSFADVTAAQLPAGLPPFHSGYAGVLADVDDDGYLDVFVGAQRNQLFVNRGAEQPGHFDDATHRLPIKPGQSLPHLQSTFAVAAGDFSGDRRVDLVTADYYEQDRLLVQQRDGEFADLTSTNLPPDGANAEDVAVGDLDLDGELDVVVASNEAIAHSIFLRAGRQSNGRPAFADRSDAIPDTELKWRGVALGDLDADGRPDLLLTGHGAARVYRNATPPGGPLAFADETAAWAPTLVANPAAMNRPELANLAGDGGLYLYLPCGAAGLTFAPEPDQLLRWDPLAFAFEDISAALPPLSAVSPAADLADVNADGVLDLLVAAEDTSSALLVSQPEWSPTAPSYAASTPFGAVQASAIRFGQLDGDAWPDAAESNWLTTAVDRIFLHSGSPGPLGVPAFTVEPLGTEPGEHRNLAIADLDGDGDQDVLVAGHLANRFFANDGAAGFAELTGHGAAAARGRPCLFLEDAVPEDKVGGGGGARVEQSHRAPPL